MAASPTSMPLTPTSPTDNLETAYLSFSNPNYQLEDRLNSNFAKTQVGNGNGTTTVGTTEAGMRNLSLNLEEMARNHKNSMLVDGGSLSLTPTPSTPDRSLVLQKLNSPSDEEASSDDEFESGPEDSVEHNLLHSREDEADHEEEEEEEEVTYGGEGQGTKKPRGFLNYYSLLEARAREKQQTTLPHSPDSPDEDLEMISGDMEPPEQNQNRENERFEVTTDINSPDSNDSGIQSDARSDDGGVPNAPLSLDKELAAAIRKSAEAAKSENESESGEGSDAETVVDKSVALPPGWQCHEDEDGPYYWHIKSGTIQREPPPPAPPELASQRSSTSTTDQSSASSVPSSPTSLTSTTEEHLQEFEGHALQYAAKSLQSLCSGKEKKVPPPPVDSNGERAVRFAVRSLGWVQIDEDDLTPEKSSKAVNRCIVDLSLGRNDLNDVVGRWGDGKDLYMDIDSKSLRLIDTQDGTFLNCQPIHSIRVWGVGRDNGRERDFAYVARDKASRRHMCHVFRCDTPARQIANTLRDICRKLMEERNKHQSLAKLSRPTDLPNLEKTSQKLSLRSHLPSASFPTPMEEPKKVIRAHYLGTQEVLRPTGMEVLNEAIERAYKKVPPEKWKFADIAVAPSTITITEHKNPENKYDECRVRYLSFMGIAMMNVKLCAFIVHSAQDKFLAYVFHCEPSAGPLCKTIEAACKLRYQKCLDAHPQTPKTPTQTKGLGASLRAGVKAGVQGVQTVIELLKTKKGQC